MDKSNIDKMKSIMFKEVDLDSINAKIDETYKKIIIRLDFLLSF